MRDLLTLRWFGSVILLLAATLLPACGAGGAVDAGDGLPPDDQFRPEITNSYFPLVRGSTRTYRGMQDGVERPETETTLVETRRLRRIDCTGIRQDLYDGPRLLESTTEWYAEDGEGNVWKFGEETFGPVGEGSVRSADSWLAGVDGVVPFIAFPAVPQAGDVYVVRRRDGVDQFVVRGVDRRVVVPAGEFSNCLEVHENPDDPEDSDIILYAPGVGRVAETGLDGYVELIDYTGSPR